MHFFLFLPKIPSDKLSIFISLIINIFHDYADAISDFSPFFHVIIETISRKNLDKEDIICLKQILSFYPEIHSKFSSELIQVLSLLIQGCKIQAFQTEQFLLLSYSFSTLSELIEDYSEKYSIETSPLELVINLSRDNNLPLIASHLIQTSDIGSLLRSALHFLSIYIPFSKDCSILSYNIIFKHLEAYSNADIRFELLRLLSIYIKFDTSFEIDNKLLYFLLKILADEFIISSSSYRILCYLVQENRIPDELIFTITNSIIDYSDIFPKIAADSIEIIKERMKLKGRKNEFEKLLQEKDWYSFIDSIDDN